MEFRPDCRPWVPRDGIEWQAADMTVIVGADVPWRAVEHEGLWAAVDCIGDASATVGSLIERNSTGPLRLGYGGWRDVLLGCQFHNGRGELITAGGRTVKNVAGYDLTKFLVGQSGIFGKVAAAAMRVYRKPQDALLAEFAPDIDLFNRLIVSPQRPQWAMLSQDRLACGYLGNRQTVDYYAQQLADWRPRLLVRHGLPGDTAWRLGHWRAAGAGSLAMRASVPPARIVEFAQRAGLSDWVADPAFGIVLAAVSTNAAAGAASAVGGHAWFWTNGGEGRLIEQDATAGERGILQHLKYAMDPDNQLAPLP